MVGAALVAAFLAGTPPANLHGLIADLALPKQRRIENTVPLQRTAAMGANGAVHSAAWSAPLE
jgi:hypothetical protein